MQRPGSPWAKAIILANAVRFNLRIGAHSCSNLIPKETCELRLPTRDSVPHLVHVQCPVINLRDGSNDALRLHRTELVIKQTFDDVRRHRSSTALIL